MERFLRYDHRHFSGLFEHGTRILVCLLFPYPFADFPCIKPDILLVQMLYEFRHATGFRFIVIHLLENTFTLVRAYDRCIVPREFPLMSVETVHKIIQRRTFDLFDFFVHELSNLLYPRRRPVHTHNFLSFCTGHNFFYLTEK